MKVDVHGKWAIASRYVDADSNTSFWMEDRYQLVANCMYFWTCASIRF
jgi:hypothetical protein